MPAPTARRPRIMAWFGLLVLLLALTLETIPARASGDHDHGPPAATPILIAPRGRALTGGIEAVAVAAPNRKLVIYLDRADTNEPLTGAAVEADADGVRLTLREAGDGVYLGDDWFASPGTNIVALTWRVAGAEGRIEIALEVPQTGYRTRAAPAGGGSSLDQASLGVAAAIALVIYLLTMALFVWRGRRRQAEAG